MIVNVLMTIAVLMLCSVIGHAWQLKLDEQVKPLSIANSLQSKVSRIPSSTKKRGFRYVESARVNSLSHFQKRNQAVHSHDHDGFFLFEFRMRIT
jgi:hypothetical protein